MGFLTISDKLKNLETQSSYCSIEATSRYCEVAALSDKKHSLWFAMELIFSICYILLVLFIFIPAAPKNIWIFCAG